MRPSERGLIILFAGVVIVLLLVFFVYPHNHSTKPSQIEMANNTSNMTQLQAVKYAEEILIVNENGQVQSVRLIYAQNLRASYPPYFNIVKKNVNGDKIYEILKPTLNTTLSQVKNDIVFYYGSEVIKPKIIVMTVSSLVQSNGFKIPRFGGSLGDILANIYVPNGYNIITIKVFNVFSRGIVMYTSVPVINNHPYIPEDSKLYKMQGAYAISIITSRGSINVRVFAGSLAIPSLQITYDNRLEILYNGTFFTPFTVMGSKTFEYTVSTTPYEFAPPLIKTTNGVLQLTPYQVYTLMQKKPIYVMILCNKKYYVAKISPENGVIVFNLNVINQIVYSPVFALNPDNFSNPSVNRMAIVPIIVKEEKIPSVILYNAEMKQIPIQGYQVMGKSLVNGKLYYFALIKDAIMFQNRFVKLFIYLPDATKQKYYPVILDYNLYASIDRPVSLNINDLKLFPYKDVMSNFVVRSDVSLIFTVSNNFTIYPGIQVTNLTANETANRTVGNSLTLSIFNNSRVLGTGVIYTGHGFIYSYVENGKVYATPELITVLVEHPDWPIMVITKTGRYVPIEDYLGFIIKKIDENTYQIINIYTGTSEILTKTELVGTLKEKFGYSS